MLIDIEGIDHPKRMFDLTEGLIRRGYSDADIRKILGQNTLRVMREAEKVSKRLQSERGPSTAVFK